MPFSSTGRVEAFRFSQAQSNLYMQRLLIDMTGFLYVTLVVYMWAPFTSTETISVRHGDTQGDLTPARDTEGTSLFFQGPGNNGIYVLELSNPQYGYLNLTAGAGTGGQGVLFVLKTDAYNAPPLGSTPDMRLNLTTGEKS